MKFETSLVVLLVLAQTIFRSEAKSIFTCHHHVVLFYVFLICRLVHIRWSVSVVDHVFESVNALSRWRICQVSYFMPHELFCQNDISNYFHNSDRLYNVIIFLKMFFKLFSHNYSLCFIFISIYLNFENTITLFPVYLY